MSRAAYFTGVYSKFSAMHEFQRIFVQFASSSTHGKANEASKSQDHNRMVLSGFSKLFKEMKGMIGVVTEVNDVELMFAKNKEANQNYITFENFVAALDLINATLFEDIKVRKALVFNGIPSSPKVTAHRVCCCCCCCCRRSLSCSASTPRAVAVDAC